MTKFILILFPTKDVAFLSKKPVWYILQKLKDKKVQRKMILSFHSQRNWGNSRLYTRHILFIQFSNNNESELFTEKYTAKLRLVWRVCHTRWFYREWPFHCGWPNTKHNAIFGNICRILCWKYSVDKYHNNIIYIAWIVPVGGIGIQLYDSLKFAHFIHLSGND